LYIQICEDEQKTKSRILLCLPIFKFTRTLGAIREPVGLRSVLFPHFKSGEKHNDGAWRTHGRDLCARDFEVVLVVTDTSLVILPLSPSSPAFFEDEEK
jgi:hypothetical protein